MQFPEFQVEGNFTKFLLKTKFNKVFFRVLSAITGSFACSKHHVSIFSIMLASFHPVRLATNKPPHNYKPKTLCSKSTRNPVLLKIGFEIST